MDALTSLNTRRAKSFHPFSKKFEKKGGIQPYIDLLKKYKEYEPMHDTYKFIESVDEVDGLFVIPELQTKIEEQQMVKKLIPNTRKDD